MGKPTLTDRDQARGLVAGAFAATGASAAIEAGGALNVTIAGTFVGTTKLRRSFDGGATWHFLSYPDDLATRDFTAPASFTVFEYECGVLYSLECTAFTSGAIAYRLSC